MANDKKFVAKNGLQTQNINYVSPNKSRTIQSSIDNNGVLTFSSSSGQIFTLTDSLTGTIYAVRDISGIPSIEVLDTGKVKLAETVGMVTIGSPTATANKLHANTTLNQSTGDEVAYQLDYTTNKLTSGNDTGLVINQVDTASPGASKLQEWQVNGAYKAYITNLGGMLLNSSLYTPGLFGGSIPFVFQPNNGSHVTGTGDFSFFQVASTVENRKSSGNQVILGVTPSYNQPTTGSANNTDLLINRTQTAVGSGTQLLIDAQVASASKFKVDNTGSITAGNTIINSSLLSNGSNSILNINSTAPTSPTNPVKGNIINFTGAGSAAYAQYALEVNLLAGYSGTSRTSGIHVTSSSSGTSLDYVTGNSAVMGEIDSTTSGVNAAFQTYAVNRGSGVAAGTIGVSWGGLGTGLRTGLIGSVIANPTSKAVGVYAYLHGASNSLLALPNDFAALVADPGTVSADIFRGNVGGNNKFSISNLGKIINNATLSGSTDEAALTLNYTSNKSAGNDNGLQINFTDTSTPGVSNMILCQNMAAPASYFFRVDGTGNASNAGSFTAGSYMQAPIFYASDGFRSGANTGVGIYPWKYGSAADAVAENSLRITPYTGFYNVKTGGQQNFCCVLPVYNQATGTASNTDLLINRTGSGAAPLVGSGTQLLIDAQVGNISKFSVSNSGNVYVAGKIGIGTITPSANIHVVASTSADYIRSDVPIDLYQVADPAGVATATLIATSGNVTPGEHRYAVTFLTALGETFHGGLFSNSVTADAVSGQVNITNIPISPDYRVTGRRIYKTTVSGGNLNFRLLTTINDNTTTTYVDNTADGSLTSTNYYTIANTTFKGIKLNNTNIVTVNNHQTFIGNSTAINATNLAHSSTFIGGEAGKTVTTGYGNTLVGYYAGRGINTNSGNTMVGAVCGFQTAGSSNVLMGQYCGYGLTTGSSNTLLGMSAGFYMAGSGSNNIFIGYTAGNYETGSNTFMLSSQSYASESAARINSLLYGIMGSTATNQTLAINAKTTVSQTLTVSGNTATTNLNVTGNLTLNNNYGNSGQVLTSNGSGSAPSWQTPTGGTPSTIFNIKTVTTNYTITGNEYTILASVPSGSNLTITLPSVVSSSGRIYNIKRIDSNVSTNLIIDGNASETIDGNTTYTIYQKYETVSLHSDGSAWYII